MSMTRWIDAGGTRGSFARRARGRTMVVAGALALAGASTARLAQADDADDAARRHVGVEQGMTKVGGGIDVAKVGDVTVVRLGGEIEHLLRNHWGIYVNGALPLAGQWVAPGTGGVRFHFLAKSAIDPFIAGASGFAWIKPTGLGADFAPMVSLRGGLAFYSRVLYAQVEGGYDFVRYAADGKTIDFGGVLGSLRLGLVF